MLSYEVITQAFVEQFVEWSEQDHHDNIPEVFWEILQQAYEKMSNNQNIAVTMRELERIMIDIIKPTMAHFKEVGNNSPTFKFWMIFLENVEVLLLNIRT